MGIKHADTVSAEETLTTTMWNATHKWSAGDLVPQVDNVYDIGAHTTRINCIYQRYRHFFYDYTGGVDWGYISFEDGGLKLTTYDKPIILNPAYTITPRIVRPATSGSIDLGSATYKFKNLNLSDRIYIGTDVNLYRSAGNILKTDDNFECQDIDCQEIDCTEITVSGTLPGGWHGSQTRIKIKHQDFAAVFPNSDQIEYTDTGLVRAYATLTLSASLAIPTGYKATKVMVYADANRVVKIWEAQILGYGVASLGNGNCNTEIDIFDTTSNSANYILVIVGPVYTNDLICGGYITIEKV